MADTRPTVLVTDPEYRKGEAVLRRRARSGVRARARDRRGARVEPSASAAPATSSSATGNTPDRSTTRCPRAASSHASASATTASTRRARPRRACICTNTPGVLDQSVAEHAMLLIAAAARKLLPALTSMASGAWTRTPGARSVRQDGWRSSDAAGSGVPSRASPRLAMAWRSWDARGRNVPAPAAIEHFQTRHERFRGGSARRGFREPAHAGHGRRITGSSIASGSRRWTRAHGSSTPRAARW